MEELDWSVLIFGSYGRSAVREAVENPRWQEFRGSLLGRSLKEKHEALSDYMHRAEVVHGRNSKQWALCACRVTNYVYALRRGGLIR